MPPSPSTSPASFIAPLKAIVLSAAAAASAATVPTFVELTAVAKTEARPNAHPSRTVGCGSVRPASQRSNRTAKGEPDGCIDIESVCFVANLVSNPCTANELASD